MQLPVLFLLVPDLFDCFLMNALQSQEAKLCKGIKKMTIGNFSLNIMKIWWYSGTILWQFNRTEQQKHHPNSFQWNFAVKVLTKIKNKKKESEKTIKIRGREKKTIKKNKQQQ